MKFSIAFFLVLLIPILIVVYHGIYQDVHWLFSTLSELSRVNTEIKSSNVSQPLVRISKGYILTPKNVTNGFRPCETPSRPPLKFEIINLRSIFMFIGMLTFLTSALTLIFINRNLLRLQ